MTWAAAGLAAAVAAWPGAGRDPGRRAALVEHRRLAPPASRDRGAPRGPVGVRVAGPVVGPVLGAAVGLAVGVTVSAPIGSGLGVVLLGVHRLLAGRSARRARTSRLHLIAAALGLVTAELEAGAGPAEALVAAAHGARSLPGPDAGELADALESGSAAHRSGRGVGAALRSGPPWCAELVGGLADAWQLTESSGAPLVAVLDRVHADALDRVAADREREQALAGPRASAYLLAGLPVIGVALGQAIAADPLAVLAGSPLGRGLAAAGAVLTVLGLLWSDRLLGGAGR